MKRRTTEIVRKDTYKETIEILRKEKRKRRTRKKIRKETNKRKREIAVNKEMDKRMRGTRGKGKGQNNKWEIGKRKWTWKQGESGNRGENGIQTIVKNYKSIIGKWWKSI